MMDDKDSVRGQMESLGTKQAILNLLKTEGSLDAESLACLLGVTAVAIRQHLANLAAEDYVDHEKVVLGRGRPLKRWHLTERAASFFPNSHDALTVELLTAVSKTFGEEGLNQLLETRSEQQRNDYLAQMASTDTIAGRLEILAGIRSREGYMAQVLANEGGGWLFIQNHCSICTAARSCQSICQQEQQVFQSLLGPGVILSRAEHIFSGGRRCVYLVEEAALNGTSPPNESEDSKIQQILADLERRCNAFLGEET